MCRRPQPTVSARDMELSREVHDLLYLALRKDPTPPERRARLHEISQRGGILTTPAGPERRALVEQMKLDRAYILEDRRVDRRVVWGTTDFTRPYQCFADLRKLPAQVDPDHHA